ncbi:MAG: hypothetical protein J3Q66DRAFT_436648 [Benniella sp.]|nr:MAG: hypothetical protein J3Q66DRAFT_436648 [Benniella sp.]
MIAMTIRRQATALYSLSKSRKVITVGRVPRYRISEKVIPGQAARKNIYGHQEEHVVLAIDPGIRNTATAVTVDSTNPNVAWNLALPLGSHSWNTTNYVKLLNQLKKERGLTDSKQKIIPFRCPDPHEVNSAKQLEGLRDSFQRHAVSVMTVEKELGRSTGRRS